MTSELKTAIIGWLLWLDAEDAQEGKSGSCEMLVAPMSDDDFQFFFGESMNQSHLKLCSLFNLWF